MKNEYKLKPLDTPIKTYRTADWEPLKYAVVFGDSCIWAVFVNLSDAQKYAVDRNMAYEDSGLLYKVFEMIENVE